MLFLERKERVQEKSFVNLAHVWLSLDTHKIFFFNLKRLTLFCPVSNIYLQGILMVGAEEREEKAQT